MRRRSVSLNITSPPRQNQSRITLYLICFAMPVRPIIPMTLFSALKAMKRGFIAKPHTADCLLELYGETPEEIFDQSARALLHEMTGRSPEQVAAGKTISYDTITLHAPSLPWLLVDWLNELIYRYDVRHSYTVETRINRLERSPANQFTLHAEIGTVPVADDLAQIQFKAATYHDLRFERTPDGWIAQVVLDV
jgi:SHS2 domain-containing protein